MTNTGGNRVGDGFSGQPAPLALRPGGERQVCDIDTRPPAFVFLSAAGGRNRPAVSDQRSAFSLALSVQLLHQYGEHPFKLDGL